MKAKTLIGGMFVLVAIVGAALVVSGLLASRGQTVELSRLETQREEARSAVDVARAQVEEARAEVDKIDAEYDGRSILTVVQSQTDIAEQNADTVTRIALEDVKRHEGWTAIKQAIVMLVAFCGVMGFVTNLHLMKDIILIKLRLD